MAEGLLAREALADHGEFRAYLHPDRGELVFEVFREADGRACLLRLPAAEAASLVRLMQSSAGALDPSAALAFDTDGAAVVGQVTIGPADRLAAVVLAEGEERAFAVWRRELLRCGWSWTIDVVVVPIELAQELCAWMVAVSRGLGKQ